MRIGISTSVVQRGKTGIAQYLFALLRAFLPHATRHSFVLFVLEQDLPLFEFAKGIMQLVPLSEKFRPAVKNIFWHQTILPKLAQDCELDVLHVPSYRRLVWRKPCALVGTIHDLAPFHVTNKYDWKRMLYARRLVPHLARRQHQLIAVSRSTARDLVHLFGLPPERIAIVRNGLEHERFQPAGREQAKAFVAQRHQLQRPFFLYIARLEHPGKNHVRLISAFNRFKAARPSEWQLVLAGTDAHGAPVIHAAVQQSPFAGDIRRLGFVPDDQVPDLYRSADVFVYPSLYEGFGMPPTEAMACGCPVICSTRGSLGEVVGEAAAVIDPEDTDSIARTLAGVAEDAGVRERLRAAGLVQARKFDWRLTAAETLDAYRMAAARFELCRGKAHRERPVPGGLARAAGCAEMRDPMLKKISRLD